MNEQNISTDKIRCPKCQTLIPITETLQHQLTESVRKEYEEKATAEKQQMIEQEKSLAAKAKELEVKEQGIEERVQTSLKSELAKQKNIALAEAKKEAREEVDVELKDLRESLKVKDEKLEKARATELELRQKERALEDRAKELDLEVARKIADEKKQVEEETAKRIVEEHRMKDAEKDKKMSDMMKQIEDLKRKAEQGSQQTQGEVQELELEKELAARFPLDNIQPVPKGMQGADVIQEVNSNNGVQCGAIIWESKRTKNWSDGWITKLKEDQRAAKADVAVIITQVLPKDVQNFGFMDGVWVTNYACFYGLALAIRQKLAELTFTKSMVAGKNEKADVIFNYLTGTEFRHRINAIIEAFSDMKTELDKERRAAERGWAKREKQLQTVILNTSGMYGDLQGLSGNSLQNIPALEAGEEEESVIE